MPVCREETMVIDPMNTRVALVAGGNSGEREISLASGKGAGDALRSAGFEVVELDPANKSDMARLFDESFDVAFLCLHGKGGEDGTVQGLLEVAGIPYTGPGVWASATAMDKSLSKIIYREQGIPTPESVTLNAEDPTDLSEVFAQFNGRIVVKPGTEGSALGVTIVDNEADMQAALDEAFSYDDEVLVEQFVSGDELTVAVIGNEQVQALPVIQIVPQMGEFYDFESKYAEGGSKHVCPAPLDPVQTRMVQELAIRAHSALRCEGVSRSDIILDEDGNAWVLETNTLPGMTSTSLLPDAGRAAGMDFSTLCTRLIELAFERAGR